MRRCSWRGALLGLAVVAVLLAGCSDGKDTTADLPLTRQQWIAQLIAEGGSEAERPYLEDRVVTEAEREAAYLAYLDCLEAKGIEVLSYELKPDGDTIHADPGDLDEAAEDELHDGCRAEHYNVVGIVFVEQNAPTAEQEAEWWREAGECMRDLGYDIPDDPTMVDLMEIAPFEASDCYDEAAGLR